MSGSRPTPVGDAISSRVMGGYDFAAYVRIMEEYAARTNTDAMTETGRDHLASAGINRQRFSRIMRSYAPAPGVRDIMGRISRKQIWMLLSEPWCGDSAQCVPYIAGIAAVSPHIVLRILLRDENPDIMDAYLTEGKRAIPKLVVFSDEYRELWHWGPRPQGAQAIFNAAMAEGVSKQVRLERLHLWYGRNRGAELESELSHLVAATLEHEID